VITHNHVHKCHKNNEGKMENLFIIYLFIYWWFWALNSGSLHLLGKVLYLLCESPVLFLFVFLIFQIELAFLPMVIFQLKVFYPWLLCSLNFRCAPSLPDYLLTRMSLYLFACASFKPWSSSLCLLNQLGLKAWDIDWHKLIFSMRRQKV
jgi:hypothetical protein